MYRRQTASSAVPTDKIDIELRIHIHDGYYQFENSLQSSLLDCVLRKCNFCGFNCAVPPHFSADESSTCSRVASDEDAQLDAILDGWSFHSDTDVIFGDDPKAEPEDATATNNEPKTEHVEETRRPAPRILRGGKSMAPYAGKVYAEQFENLARFFHLTREEAAQRLDISVTLLKRKCRRLGIQRWPYRKIRALQERLVRVCASLSESGAALCDESDPNQTVELLKEKEWLEDLLSRVRCDPNVPLPPDLPLFSGTD